MPDRVRLTRDDLKEIDRAALFGLVAIGDQEAILELGHFGSGTVKEARELLKKCRAKLRSLERNT
jgi:hypothetical protein